MCSHNGKEVLRSLVTCEKKNGCREIETHGECCPRFLCGKLYALYCIDDIRLKTFSNYNFLIYVLECKLNGTIYDNGDKIVDPENPCEVCVCRGVNK